MASDGNDQVLGSIHGKTPRARLKKGMDALIAHRKLGRMHYTQDGRRMKIVRDHLIPPFGNVHIYEDCSSSVTGLYFMAGLHDPNELHFNGTGYTGTLILHGKEVSGPPFRIGDLVFYGPKHAPTHVAMIYSSSAVWSHGHEGGPVVEPIDYRSDRSSVRRYL